LPKYEHEDSVGINVQSHIIGAYLIGMYFEGFKHPFSLPGPAYYMLVQWFTEVSDTPNQNPSTVSIQLKNLLRPSIMYLN